MPTELKRSQKIVLILVLCLLLLLASANLIARMVMPGIVQKEISLMLDTPVRIRKAGINFLSASFWLKDVDVQNIEGLSHPVFLSVKRISVNLSFASLFARQLIFQKIYFEEPVLNLERDKNASLNLEVFQTRAQERFKPRIKLGRQHFFTGYEINQFSVKDGVFSYLDLWAPEGQKKWRVHHATFSFSNLMYPPQLIDPIPTSLFLSAKIEGVREGSILILGSGNFLAAERNFKVRSDIKNVLLRELNPFLPDFPLRVKDGYLDLRSEAICKNDLLELSNNVTVSGLKLEEKPGFSKTQTVFGYTKKDVVDLFQSMEGKSFDFDFRLAGDLNNPKFSFEKLFNESMSQAIQTQLGKAFEQLKQGIAPPQEEKVYTSQRRIKKNVKNVSFKEAAERLTGIKLPGD